MPLKIRPDVAVAVREWWFSQSGVLLPEGTVEIQDPHLIERLFQYSIPDEDINDTILRIIRGGSSGAIH